MPENAAALMLGACPRLAAVEHGSLHLREAQAKESPEVPKP